MIFLENLYISTIAFLNFIAVVVFVWGALWAAAFIFAYEIRIVLGHKRPEIIKYVQIKQHFTHRIALGLEFLLVSDLLLLIQNRTTDDLLKVAGLVAIRIAINYFLNEQISLFDTVFRKSAKQAPQGRNP